jgi:hypothetical protein
MRVDEYNTFEVQLDRYRVALGVGRQLGLGLAQHRDCGVTSN